MGCYYERGGFLQVMWKTILFFFSILWVFVAFIVSVGIYVLKLIRRKEKSYLYNGAYTYPDLAGILWLLTMYVSTQLDDLHVVASMNITTALLATSSGVMPFKILLGLISMFRNSAFFSPMSRRFLYGTYGAWIIFLVILFSYGLIPVITRMR